MSEELSPKARLLLSIGISVVILFVVLLFYFKSESKLSQFSFSGFKFYSFSGNQIQSTSFRNNEKGFIYIYNVTGYKRAYDNKIYLAAVIRVLSKDNIPRKSKKVLLEMYSDYPGSTIPVVRVLFDFKGIAPGQYLLQVSLYDQISNQMYSKEIPILISGTEPHFR